MIRAILYLVCGFTLTLLPGISIVSSFLVTTTRRRSYGPPCVFASTTKHNNESDNQHKVQLVNDFVRQVQQSVLDKVFVSLTLHGSSKPKKYKTIDDSIRGSIRQVQGRLIQVKKKSNVLQLTIKYHGATDICKNIMTPEDIPQQLSELILHPLVSEWGAESLQPLEGAELKTLQDIWELKSLHRLAKLQSKKLPIQTKDGSVLLLQPASHDRVKQVPLSQNTEFLQSLGLTKLDGSPRPGMSSKLRQCNKFVEIVSGLIGKTTPSNGIRVVDMGCGRGYLTFALHSYLCQQYPQKVESIGIDVRPKLVAEISGIAQSLGAPFHTLSFQTGTIEEIVAGTTSIFGDTVDEAKHRLDILIALHACDTATDDALWSGISQRADIIVVAPCCHKQIRPQINAHVASSKESHPLYDVLKHGVYRERLSETVTDSLRALLLEQAGYKVQVFEFIGGEHTSKNVMITAIRGDDTTVLDRDSYTSRRIQELAEFHGITEQKLADWMGQPLGNQAAHPHEGRRTRLTITQMPPRS